MSTLVPRSLFGRLLWLMTGGLVLTQVLSIGIHLTERGETLYRTMALHAAHRVVTIVNRLDGAAPEERERLVAILDVPPNRIALTQTWGDRSPDVSHKAALFESHLRGALPRALLLRVDSAGDYGRLFLRIRI